VESDFELRSLQVLYCLNHTSSSHLRHDLDFENLLFWQFSVVPHLFLKQLKLFILNERIKIEYYLQSISHVHQDCNNPNEFLERRKRWLEIKTSGERVLKRIK
jgi:hypothetical protein